MEFQGAARETSCEGDGEVRHGINGEVLSDRGHRDC